MQVRTIFAQLESPRIIDEVHIEDLGVRKLHWLHCDKLLDHVCLGRGNVLDDRKNPLVEVTDATLLERWRRRHVRHPLQNPIFYRIVVDALENAIFQQVTRCPPRRKPCQPGVRIEPAPAAQV